MLQYILAIMQEAVDVTIVAMIYNRTLEEGVSPSSNIEISVENSCSKQHRVCAS